MARDREKESYTHVVILLLMRCVRPVLTALVEDLVRKQTPRGEKTWSIDEFLACHKRRIEKELPVIDKYNVYKNILYPTNTENPKTDTNKWDLTLFVFILTKACKIEQELAYYTGQITSIREDFCKARFPGITRSMCKDYRKRLSRVRSRLHKELRDDDLKKKIESRAKRIEARNTSSSEKEEILKQWKDIEVVQRLKGAAKKTGVQKYLTIKMLLSKSCCGVMQALVFNSVRNNRPIRTTRWSLDCFLQRHKSRIGRRIWSLDKLGRPMDVLFPKGRTTQIDEWDISLLCWVLLNVCFLEKDIADSIGEIRTIRNEIAHNSSLSLSDLAYNSYLERIKSSIDTCSSFINDEELSESINDQVEDIEQTSVDKDETIRRLQESYQNDISEKEQQEKHLEVQQNILSELSRIVKKFKDIEIPECELELVINNCNQENENTMSKAIVEEINEKLESEQGHSSSSRNQKFRAAVKTMLRETKSKGWSLTKATKGSVLLNVRCRSFDDLCQLYNTYRGNGSDLHVVDLRSALHCTMGVDVKLHLVMYDIEMDKCVEKIVTAVMEATKRMTSRTANEIKKEYEPPSPSWDDCTSEGERRINLDNRLLKKRKAVTSHYYVSDQTPLAMTEEWNQHTSDDVDMAARDKAEYEQQLSCSDNPDDRSPCLEMEYTVSDISGMEVEYQDAAKRTGVQKYLTIKMLLSKSCCGVMQALVFNSVRINRPNRTTRWSLDCFLQRYKSRILRRIWSLDKLGRPIDILFPKGRTTQIDEWDISLLCWVLLNVCFLEEDIADSIGKIRTVRNEINHNRLLSLSDLAYNSYLERIKSSIDTCLSFINDEELSESIHDQVENIEQTSLDKDETIRLLQESYQNNISEYEQQLIEYTVSESSGMKVEYQDVKQAVKETDLAINKTDTKYDLKLEDTVTGSPGISFVYGPKTLEEEFKREMVTCFLETYLVLNEDICGNTYFDNCYVEPPLINLCPEEEFFYFNEETIPDRGTRIESLKDVFFHHSVPIRNIYLTADAGFGKTAYTKRLVMMWCMAHGCYETEQKLKKQTIQESALETMRNFEFLFCIPLREAGFAVCEMESLVYDHVVKRLPKPYMFPKEFIYELLQRENTLVILDGLDEWSHPKTCEKQGVVPHRNETSHCTILTTTRPCKLSALRLHDTIIDKVVKISKLDEGASRRLACNLISTWNSKGKCSKLKTYEDFEEKLSLENVGDVKLVPYVLLQLIRLWYNGKRMGRSMCEILGNILALKTGCHTLNPFDDGYEHRGFARLKKLPAKNICVTSYPCDLTILGKLAFDGLFCHQNNPVLVFEQGVVDEGKLSRYIEMGILCMTIEKRISFQHKILQEYLAALYIQSQENEDMIEKMVQSCTSVTSVLDQKNVIMFLAYLDPNVVNTIWQTLQPNISNSAIVLKYRNRLIMSREDICNIELVKEFQEMIVSISEVTGRTFQLEDIVMEDIRNTAHVSALIQLMESHGDSVKSIRVNGMRSKADFLPLLKLLTTSRGLQKLSMAGIDNEFLLPHVMLHSADTLRSVSLESYHTSEHTGHFESISSEILQILVQLQKLQSLSLRHWQFTDEKLRYFYRVLKAQTDMKQFMLEGLACQNCDGFELDLFQDQLQGITIYNVPVTKLHADLSSLEYCCLGGLPPGVEASILAMLKGATKLRTLYLRSVPPNCMTSDGQGNTLADVLLISKRLKRLSFIILDFDGINLDKQTCNDLTNFIEKIQETRRQVTVILKISNSVGHCCCDSFRSFPVFLQKVSVSCNSDCRLAICKSKGLLG